MPRCRGRRRSPPAAAPRGVPFRDNPRLILAGIVAARACWRPARAGRSPSRLSPDFLTEVVLYALSATNLMMLLGLVFVLARNIIKLMVERRRGAAVCAVSRASWCSCCSA